LMFEKFSLFFLETECICICYFAAAVSFLCVYITGLLVHAPCKCHGHFSRMM